MDRWGEIHTVPESKNANEWSKPIKLELTSLEAKVVLRETMKGEPVLCMPMEF